MNNVVYIHTKENEKHKIIAAYTCKSQYTKCIQQYVGEIAANK